MKNLLIGSRALAYWTNLKINESTDWDVISDTKIEGTEWHDPNFLNNKELDRYATKDYIIYQGHKLYVVSLTGLAIIKRSHLWRNLKFNKHITHYYQYGLHDVFKDLADVDQEVYKNRLTLSCQEFSQPQPKLNVTKNEFFTDGVKTRIYDHDYLHELVAFQDKPLYIKLQRKDDEIMCHKYLWDKLTEEEKLLCVIEEAEVTALERFLIPKITPYASCAYVKSLEKICTTMCSGYFRDFAIDNYDKLVKYNSKEKLINILKGLNNDR